MAPPRSRPSLRGKTRYASRWRDRVSGRRFPPRCLDNVRLAPSGPFVLVQATRRSCTRTRRGGLAVLPVTRSRSAIRAHGDPAGRRESPGAVLDRKAYPRLAASRRTRRGSLAVGSSPPNGVPRRPISRSPDPRLLWPRLDARRHHLYVGQRRAAAGRTSARRCASRLSLGRPRLSSDTQLSARYVARLQLRLDQRGVASLRLRPGRGRSSGAGRESLFADLDRHLAFLRRKRPGLRLVGNLAEGLRRSISDLGRPALHDLASEILPVRADGLRTGDFRCARFVPRSHMGTWAHTRPRHYDRRARLRHRSHVPDPLPCCRGHRRRQSGRPAGGQKLTELADEVPRHLSPRICRGHRRTCDSGLCQLRDRGALRQRNGSALQCLQDEGEGGLECCCSALVSCRSSSQLSQPLAQRAKCPHRSHARRLGEHRALRDVSPSGRYQ